MLAPTLFDKCGGFCNVRGGVILPSTGPPFNVLSKLHAVSDHQPGYTTPTLPLHSLNLGSGPVGSGAPLSLGILLATRLDLFVRGLTFKGRLPGAINGGE
ncbi:hypothetical protein Bbelb_038470 [Branchiostoma belcheri]|nr:hypothetical protein Bbelb_038470 [Branchiostoma belcheri]